MTTENTQQLKENPKILGAVDLPKINLREYDNKESVIESVTIEDNALYGKYAKITTAVLSEENKKPEIRASKILGLIEITDEETDEIKGYGWGKESKTASFLKKYEVENLNDLVGKKVITRFEVIKDKEILTI
jgi:hypothetical protein